MRIHPYIEQAYKVLDGEELSEAEALALTKQPGKSITDVFLFLIICRKPADFLMVLPL